MTASEHDPYTDQPEMSAVDRFKEEFRKRPPSYGDPRLIDWDLYVVTALAEVIARLEALEKP